MRRATLQHADIMSLDMPAMPRVVSIRDKVVLDAKKAGDKVRFKVVNDAGWYTAPEVQAVK